MLIIAQQQLNLDSRYNLAQHIASAGNISPAHRAIISFTISLSLNIRYILGCYYRLKLDLLNIKFKAYAFHAFAFDFSDYKLHQVVDIIFMYLLVSAI